MKVLIINPNSSKEMTDAIFTSAKDFVKDRFEVDVTCLLDSPPFIGCYDTIAQTKDGILNCIKETEENYDAFVIACHLDPNLDAAKGSTNKLVFGIGETSIKMASMLSDKFSIIGANKNTTSLKKELVDKYGVTSTLRSIQNPDEENITLSLEEKLIDAAKKAVFNDGANLIVLGCAGFAGIDKKIEKIVKVPVMDGIICSLILAEGLLLLKK